MILNITVNSAVNERSVEAVWEEGYTTWWVMDCTEYIENCCSARHSDHK